MTRMSIKMYDDLILINIRQQPSSDSHDLTQTVNQKVKYLFRYWQDNPHTVATTYRVIGRVSPVGTFGKLPLKGHTHN